MPPPRGTVTGTLAFFSCPPLPQLVAPDFGLWCPARCAQRRALPVLFGAVSCLSLIHKVVASWHGVHHKPARLIPVFPRRGAVPVTSKTPDDASVMGTCNYTRCPSPGCPEPCAPTQRHKPPIKPSQTRPQGAIPPGDPLPGHAWGGMDRPVGLGASPGIRSCCEGFAVMLSA